MDLAEQGRVRKRSLTCADQAAKYVTQPRREPLESSLRRDAVEVSGKLQSYGLPKFAGFVERSQQSQVFRRVRLRHARHDNADGHVEATTLSTGIHRFERRRWRSVKPVDEVSER